MAVKSVIFLLYLLVGFIDCAILSDVKKTDIECESYNEQNCSSQGVCDTKIETCKLDSDSHTASCFVLWKIDPTTNVTNVSMKGCFTESHECNQTECVSNSDPKQNLNFCCCQGSFCNSEYKWIQTTTEATTEVPKQKTTDENTLYVMIACLVLLILATSVAIGLFVYKRRKQAMFNEIPSVEPEISKSSPCLALRPIELVQMKARGRFGAVWQGRLRNEEVAVKVFPIQEKESWMAEQDIYKLPRMKHSNILEFMGAEKHLDQIQQEYWLITAYHTYGSLCDYLKAHQITWSQLCKIAETMSRGLMHLHEEIGPSKTEKLKPAVAHRDFKSKNVLLKTDLTACIADFGLAMVFQPGKSCGDTHGQVGTRRYMAPEVLEGAINFNRDAFLRIDVYACGLVLWEMASRCNVIGEPMEYTLPFETELGLHPTLDQMQESVVMKKLRPAIPDRWREHSGLNGLCDTMEECWDHDAEARLSSSCVMERVSQHNRYQMAPLLIETNTDHLLNNSTHNL